jgi:hypothetical protein
MFKIVCLTRLLKCDEQGSVKWYIYYVDIVRVNVIVYKDLVLFRDLRAINFMLLDLTQVRLDLTFIVHSFVYGCKTPAAQRL